MSVWIEYESWSAEIGLILDKINRFGKWGKDGITLVFNWWLVSMRQAW